MLSFDSVEPEKEEDEEEEQRPYSVKKKRGRKEVGGKKHFVKINSKKNKKKLTFNELTFVEPHVDTFYMGMNDEVPRGAYNPVQAKTVELEEATNWVHPDSQFNKLKKTPHHNLKWLKAKPQRVSTVTTKLKELTFVEEDKRADNDVAEEENCCHAQPCGGMHLESLFDQENATVFLGAADTTLLTPKSHKIYVEDTPVENYGLSLRERRKKGLHI